MDVIISHEVFEKIDREHDALRDKLRRIHAVLAGPEVAAGEIAALLREFHSVLMLHFDNEEEPEGFFDEVTGHAPQLADRADRLCVEHQELLHKAVELYRFAAAGSPSMAWWRELRCRCHEFSKQWMHHESEENTLLQQAHQEDLGVHD